MAEAQPLGKSLVLPMTGRARAVGQSKDYLIEVAVPAGAKVKAQKGSPVRVTLPILHHQNVQGTLQGIREGGLEILLSNQVQELNGQTVGVEIPLSGEGLFRVPFTSVYSPRGRSARVFVLAGDRVEAKPAEVISLFGPTEVLVAAALGDKDRVVVQGTDNLLSGDAVEVVP